jgi:hypothetical protein
MIISGFLLSLSLLAAQQQSQHLELQFRSEALQDGLPPGFTILLVNKSDHDIRVPKPIVDCAAIDGGVIGMSFRFTPKRPWKPRNGYGCAADQFNPPPILERVHGWQVLRPGESLRVTDSPAQMHCECKAPGKYEFWAGYDPPHLPAEDEAKLDEADIDFPRSALESAHITYVKKR